MFSDSSFSTNAFRSLSFRFNIIIGAIKGLAEAFTRILNYSFTENALFESSSSDLKTQSVIADRSPTTSTSVTLLDSVQTRDSLGVADSTVRALSSITEGNLSSESNSNSLINLTQEDKMITDSTQSQAAGKTTVQDE